jgi:outer membrane protein assembly factor BamB
MSNSRKYAMTLMLIGLLLGGLPRGANCSVPKAEQHMGIKDGYIYVLPFEDSFFKIEEESGTVIWKEPMAWPRPDGIPPSRFGYYSRPVFVDARLFAVETMAGPALFALDRATGRFENKNFRGDICGLGHDALGQLIYDDLMLIFRSSGIQAINPHDLKIKWQLTCEDDNFNGLSDYFRIGESLYLLSSRPPKEDKSDRHWPVVNELLELNCATGEVVGRYGWDSLYGETTQQMLGIKEIGEWRGNRLILLMTYDPSLNAESYALCSFNPVSKSMNLLIDELADPRDHETGYRIDTSEPLASDGLFFHSYTVDADRTLIAWNLADGKAQWKQRTDEYLHIAGGRTLFTVEESKRHSKIICRDAVDGDIRWKRKLKKNTQYSGIWEMKLSGGRLYVLVNDFLYALDAENGEELWEVEIYSDPDDASSSDDSLWSRILSFFD